MRSRDSSPIAFLLKGGVGEPPSPPRHEWRGRDVRRSLTERVRSQKKSFPPTHTKKKTAISGGFLREEGEGRLTTSGSTAATAGRASALFFVVTAVHVLGFASRSIDTAGIAVGRTGNRVAVGRTRDRVIVVV